MGIAYFWKIIDHGPDSYDTKSRIPRRRIPGIPSGKKPINIFNFSSENNDKGHYNGPGKRYSFRLNQEGRIEYRSSDLGEDFKGDWLLFQADTNKGMTTFHASRKGKVKKTPKFEVFTVSGNRIFAKEYMTDRLFITTIDHLFWNYEIKNQNYTPISAAIFFKLDPEQGIASSNKNLVVSQIQNSQKYNYHPATLRFDVYKKVLISPFNQSMMIVNQKPKQWYQIDSRSPADKKDPKNYPLYHHVTYQNPLFPQLQKNTFSIDYKKILSLGIGSTHWHEQYSTIFGGEIQPIYDNKIGPFSYSSIFYKLMNGPIEDGDGFIDGTVNYYMLCELNQKDNSKQKYAILTMDEQFYFSSRWRVVGLDDIDKSDIMDFSVVKAIDNPIYNFKKEMFWDPFKNDCIDGFSRLATSRQILVVNGIQDNKHYLFSINYSYTTMDRSWRRRELPSQNINYFLDHSSPANPHHPNDIDEIINVVHDNSVDPSSILIKDDMTIILKGTKSFYINGIKHTYQGRYFQKYLPSTLKYPDLIVDAPGLFNHKWQFVTETVYKKMERYSHFGIYEKVDDRHQYYKLEGIKSNDIGKLDDEKIIWKDIESDLRIWYLGINVKNILNLPRSLIKCFFGACDTTLLSNKHKQFQKPLSLYNDGTYFKVYDRNLNGNSTQIAVFADKRDDDLMPATIPELKVKLKNTKDDTVTIESEFSEHHFIDAPPQIQEAGFTIFKDKPTGDNIIKIRIYFIISEKIWNKRLNSMISQNLNESVYKIKIGVPDEEQFLFDLKGNQFKYDNQHSMYIYDEVNLSQNIIKKCEKYCTQKTYWKHGTSIWFEDIIGQKNIAEFTKFSEI